ncbi:hypothetical protein M9458_052204, partial [Cirrhinus mrigala]
MVQIAAWCSQSKAESCSRWALMTAYSPQRMATTSPGAPRQGCAETQLALEPSQVCLSPGEPPCTDPVQDQGGQGAGSARCALLAHPNLVCRPHAPHDSPSLEDSPEEGPSFSGDGHNQAPAVDLSGFPQAMKDSITQATAPSTKQTYALKW